MLHPAHGYSNACAGCGFQGWIPSMRDFTDRPFAMNEGMTQAQRLVNDAYAAEAEAITGDGMRAPAIRRAASSSGPQTTSGA